MSDADRAVALTAHRQHGLITRRRALELLSSSAIDRRLAAGRWQALERSVYVISGAPITWRTKVLAACLATGGVASHRSAAVLHRVDRFREGRPEISVPVRSRFDVVDARVHQSSDFDRFRLVRIDGIPVTPLPRMAVDLGGVVAYPSYRAAIESVIGDGRVSWEQLAQALMVHARAGRTGVGALRRFLEANMGKELDASALERAFFGLCPDSSLPVPERQVSIYDDEGFIARVDFAYTRWKVVIELDSRTFHLRSESFESDRAKRNRLVAAGWTVLEITWDAVMRNPQRVLRLIERTLARCA